MSENILIILSCGTDNPNRSTRALFLAMAAHKAGKNTTVFLLDEGVYLAKEGLAENLKAASIGGGLNLIGFVFQSYPLLFSIEVARRIDERQTRPTVYGRLGSLF